MWSMTALSDGPFKRVGNELFMGWVKEHPGAGQLEHERQRMITN